MSFLFWNVNGHCNNTWSTYKEGTPILKNQILYCIPLPDIRDGFNVFCTELFVSLSTIPTYTDALVTKVSNLLGFIVLIKLKLADDKWSFLHIQSHLTMKWMNQDFSWMARSITMTFNKNIDLSKTEVNMITWADFLISICGLKRLKFEALM